MSDNKGDGDYGEDDKEDIFAGNFFFRDNVQKQMCHDCIYKDQNVEHLNKKNYVLFRNILKGNLCVSC